MKAKVVQEHRMTLQRQHRLKGHLDEFKSRVVRAQRGIGRLKSFVDTADFGGIAHIPEQMENDPWLHQEGIFWMPHVRSTNIYPKPKFCIIPHLPGEGC